MSVARLLLSPVLSWCLCSILHNNMIIGIYRQYFKRDDIHCQDIHKFIVHLVVLNFLYQLCVCGGGGGGGECKQTNKKTD